MDRRGSWSLAPAFDLTFAWNPAGAWTSRHQMSVSGKRDDFVHDDLVQLGRAADLSPRRAVGIIDDVLAAASQWRVFAAEADVAGSMVDAIETALRFR